MSHQALAIFYCYFNGDCLLAESKMCQMNLVRPDRVNAHLHPSSEQALVRGLADRTGDHASFAKAKSAIANSNHLMQQ